MDDKLLQSYFEGRTTDEQSRRITEWLDADAANMKHYQRLCRLYELSLWHEETEHTVKSSEPGKSRWLPFMREALKIAAIFMLGFLLNHWFNPGVTEKAEEAVMQMVHVPSGQNAQLILADGSKVWLNAGSTLNFPTRFEKGKRQVTLEGEGFFEVKADKEKPFIVSTALYDVKAVGTSFNVHAYSQSNEFETALLTGKVEIKDRMAGHSLSLLPNSRAVRGKQGLTVLPIESTDYFLWREGILYFDEPLTEVLDKLELYFDVNIRVNNRTVLGNKRHCTGKFRMRDGLNHILTVLQLTNHFTYVIDEERNMVTIN